MESTLYLRIKELCKDEGITLKELCEITGVKESNLTKWKNGTSPSIDSIRPITSHFHVSLDYLIGDSNIPQNADTILKDADIISLQRAKLRISNEDQALWDSSMEMLRRTFDRAFSKEDKT